MSNIIKMEVQQSIKVLKSKGWSDHRIVRELGINRRTVKRYASDSKCTNSHTGKRGPLSQCEPHRDRILEWYQSGLSIERIHQDLKTAHGFTGSYHSIRRFVKTLKVDELERVHRMECEAGQEAQIDYGKLYLPIGENWRLKKVHVLLVTLSHSRKEQRGSRAQTGHYKLPAKPGKRVPTFWWRTLSAVPGQPGCGVQQG